MLNSSETRVRVRLAGSSFARSPELRPSSGSMLFTAHARAKGKQFYVRRGRLGIHPAAKPLVHETRVDRVERVFLHAHPVGRSLETVRHQPPVLTVVEFGQQVRESSGRSLSGRSPRNTHTQPYFSTVGYESTRARFGGRRVGAERRDVHALAGCVKLPAMIGARQAAAGQACRRTRYRRGGSRYPGSRRTGFRG